MASAIFGGGASSFEVLTAEDYAARIGRRDQAEEIAAIAKVHGNSLGRHKDSQKLMYSSQQLFALCIANKIFPVVRGVTELYPSP